MTRTQTQPVSVAELSPELNQLLAAAGQIILGKEEVLKLALSCILADGHLLVEDLPGVGKTTLAHTLDRCTAETDCRIAHRQTGSCCDRPCN